MPVQLYRPDVIQAATPMFWALVVIVAIFVLTAGIALRILFKFIFNHMSESSQLNKDSVKAMGAIAERLTAVETLVSECPQRKK